MKTQETLDWIRECTSSWLEKATTFKGEFVSALMKPRKYPTDYASNVAPPCYKCTVCKKHGVKLWRQYQTFADQIELMCATCAVKDQKKDYVVNEDGKHKDDSYGDSDQIGWLVPAVPDEEGYSYWGYTSVPQAGVNWWKRLPTNK